MALGLTGLMMAINQTFALKLLGFYPIGNAFLYYLIGIFLAAALLCFPARKADVNRLPWYDWLLATTALGCSIYLGVNGLRMTQEGWEFFAPIEATMTASLTLLLVLEGVRRCGGWAIFAVALVFGLYPLYADHMPGFLWSNSFALDETIRAHVMGAESIIGVPMQVVANLIIGFVVFGIALTVTGGGDFFMNFATALMGKSRGGPAKVAVISSAFMGSLSGSAVSNILTTGTITIPAMKRSGYSAEYAAAVEACSSTGGTLMPPVMGAVAFIMASFLGVSYGEVMMAALLPAILFYLALLLQVDNYAARKGLKGMQPEEIPRVLDTLKSGWPYLLSLAVLIYMLLVMRMESHAPYYATLVLLVISLFRRHQRLSVRKGLDFMYQLAHNIGNLVAILAGIGLVVGGLSYTGVAGSFSRELLLYAGGSIPLMLAAGAVTSFVLGMGMTVSACYIFLSILLAPALVAAGLNPLGSHLFILYWGMLSYITPPVALAAITAAGVAGASNTRTSLHAVRLGGVLFVLPFLFVLNPALILQGPVDRIVLSSLTAITAIWLVAASMEGYLYRVGNIKHLARLVLLLAAALLIYPEWISDLIGLTLLGCCYLAHRVAWRRLPTDRPHDGLERQTEGR
ncbi:C4-dicarboxylate ABC transporter [Halomonas urumqiensis]|uniref:C4-dicarboxylate ABC transporter n=2 Tax=Halomonas urumqiensis TaxID=1684789 RepID=A0A2N7ULW8_9GAMM|nr:C4-dicarboxylate ABC transporter [Halomonas urumqiensis]PTB01225.1 C4-dicarboxylate ABC transporter [Halomonas urumqiensis]GHE22785.1 C4-dicarboxylate ABC transporter [Halomonas urumqiensis]